MEDGSGQSLLQANVVTPTSVAKEMIDFDRHWSSIQHVLNNGVNSRHDSYSRVGITHLWWQPQRSLGTFWLDAAHMSYMLMRLSVKLIMKWMTLWTLVINVWSFGSWSGTIVILITIVFYGVRSEKMAPKCDTGVKKIISPGLIYFCLTLCTNEAGASKWEFIFHNSWPFCHSFSSLFLTWPYFGEKNKVSSFVPDDEMTVQYLHVALRLHQVHFPRKGIACNHCHFLPKMALDHFHTSTRYIIEPTCAFCTVGS